MSLISMLDMLEHTCRIRTNQKNHLQGGLEKGNPFLTAILKYCLEVINLSVYIVICKFRGKMQNLICKKWAPLKPHNVSFLVTSFYFI